MWGVVIILTRASHRRPIFFRTRANRAPTQEAAGSRGMARTITSNTARRLLAARLMSSRVTLSYELSRSRRPSGKVARSHLGSTTRRSSSRPSKVARKLPGLTSSCGGFSRCKSSIISFCSLIGFQPQTTFSLTIFLETERLISCLMCFQQTFGPQMSSRGVRRQLGVWSRWLHVTRPGRAMQRGKLVGTIEATRRGMVHLAQRWILSS